ncbi:MAG: LysR family transcriptional regulator [Synergistaceae bacterium]|nr:LysR family transcriptional regulator [Synergistaceae bacterium]
MKNSFKMFLLLAEELNFCKAADRAHIIQQAMSDHIRRLETEYGTQFFVRKPQLRLTPAGEAMRSALMNIRLQENEMNQAIIGIRDGLRGKFAIGLNHTRAQILIPKVFHKFYEAFPLIKLQIRFGETTQMKADLLLGTLSGFLGVNTPVDPQFRASPIYSDSLYLFNTL